MVSANIPTDESLVRRAVMDVASLPEEDLPLVIEFVDYLNRRRQTTTEKKLSTVEIRAQARRRASALKDVPRQELVARFNELTEAIRAQAIAKDTAIDGDWQGD